MSQDITEEKLNAIILRLTYGCPIEQKNSNCPLKEIRNKEFNEMINWVSWLSYAEKLDIYQRHETCLSRHQS